MSAAPTGMTGPRASGGTGTLTVHVPFRVMRRSGRRTVTIPDSLSQTAPGPMPDHVLIHALARAFRWKRLLERRSCAMAELAASEGIDLAYFSRVLRLTHLAPQVIDALLDGRQREGIGLAGVIAIADQPWSKHHSLIRE